MRKVLLVFCLTLLIIGCASENAQVEQGLVPAKDSIQAEPREPSQPQKQEPDTTCMGFPGKLAACEPYECTYIHPFMGMSVQRQVLGQEQGGCAYTEQVPPDQTMKCVLEGELLEAVVKEHEQGLKRLDTQIGIDADTGSGDVQVTYTVDGQEVRSPLSEAMNQGHCVFT